MAAVVALLLWRTAAPGPPRISLAVFGIALVGLYATSGLYHLPRWPSHVRRRLGRADVAVIQLFIAASFTPIAVHALAGAWLVISLTVAWTIGIVGAVIAASPLRAPRRVTVAAYVAFGGLAVLPLIRVAEVIPEPGLALIIAGGLLYIVGGLIYARRNPDPWPLTFGYHEVFHTLVVLAGAAHVVALWRYTLPLG